MRVGIAGVGFGRHVLAPALRMVPNCELVAIAASTPERGIAAAGDLGIRRGYGDWRELLLDPAVDVVALALPPDVQAEAARQAIAAGKPVFAEKPLAHSLEAATQMTRAAAASGLPCGVDLPFREIPAFRAAKGLLTSGQIGPVRHIAVTWHVESYANLHRRVSWKTDPARGGGTLKNFVSHVLDYLEWLNGQALSVSARLLKMPGDVRDTDTFDVLAVEFANGAAASISVSAAAFAGSGHRVEIYGEDGTLTITNSTSDYMRGFDLLRAQRKGPSGIVPLDSFDLPSGLDGRIFPVSLAAGAFLAAVRAGRAAVPGFADGLRNQLLMEAAILSHKSGSLVTIDDLGGK